MSAVIALVGRPNVGKSTLFNCLTRSQAALVADYPGLTRDRQFGIGKLGAQPYIVVDTGGLTTLDKSDDVFALMQKQVHIAINEADIILFLVDARAGLTPDDSEIAHYLRTVNKPVYVVINKADGMDADIAMLDFYSLGMAQAFVIAASHGRGVAQMIDTLLASASTNVPQTTKEEVQGVCVAVLGRPNVGKSTLVNRILGEERVLTFNAPGTTRDSIYIPFEKNGQSFTLVDTAGIRRRSKTHAAIEKFSVIKALQAIDAAHVVILVLDAQEGVTDQDMHLLGRILEQGRALLIAVNKWDGLAEEQREQVKNGLARKLSFIDFAETFFISALHGSNVGLLLDAVVSAYRSAYSDFSTAQLTNLLEEALIVHQPPLVKGRRIKLRYAHQGGKNPPLIVIHGNQTEYLPDAYRRYLARHYQQRLKLQGTPVRIEVKTSHNPYRNRRNKLTPRQLYRKKRLLRHVKKQK